MSATDVISELQKFGGTADYEWHGEKVEMKTHENHNEEGEYDEEGEEHDGDAGVGRFEIEVQESTKRQNALNGKDSNKLDALQQQRSSGTVF